MNRRTLYVAHACAVSAGFGTPAHARATAQEVQSLGNELTCMGSEKAGNKEGTIPEFSGKWTGVPPGVNYKGAGNTYPDPYAHEKPLFVITAKNMQSYADKLSDGQKALFNKYPDTFQMPVYPTHRDFGYLGAVCELAKENAAQAELEDSGAGLQAINGAPPFPIPKNGLELLWNHQLAGSVYTYRGLQDQAVVYPNGEIAWGRVHFEVFLPAFAPNTKSKTNGIYAHFKTKILLPERQKGEIVVGSEHYNHRQTPRIGYIYNPGTRRVRQLPAYGFDMPQGPGGFRTIDDDRLFNGSPERYDWKILGKKEMIVPWNAYRIQQPNVKYADLLKPHHVNPDYMRYELRRVWVLEAKLKDGFRHQYARRVMYLDEDSWNGMMADHYDMRGQLWRVAMVNYFYAYDAGIYINSTSIYHDLNSGAYMTDKMTNGQAPVINAGGVTPVNFTPDSARMEGL
ncbi:DUF1329 domain-containing protein [Noviherbaspirillum saxi]|uniref:DUF1329 domain-containing protein n=1 Tax=Noviherbaspirillum saxi TaxID=2320863 RepID=A0A3A3FGP4_9BURK|nr:DUF1329 domain-containing protein [Noviherbaspirillum saxi]RJF92566.1 DUF1329 domain-containing protein [Noviherbaspirillum saxi]